MNRADEKCLVRCGLVHLLDRLCNLTNYRSDAVNSEAQSMRQRVSAMAWAGFQVLSNRCVMWEQEDSEYSILKCLLVCIVDIAGQLVSNWNCKQNT